MGSCCSVGKPPKKEVGHRLGGSDIQMRQIPSSSANGGAGFNMAKPQPAKLASDQNDLPDRQKILEATEKRLQENKQKGVQKGQGQLSKKLEDEKKKKLTDYAREDLALREQEDNLQWRQD
ncbi:hypothetical protein DSO57_1025699 [Entomophthora muscae]|uniref:Uncharacterized protein n=1 Tax=Entomophthora muscae TaxID=34485 RepID=A0ACC2SR59_9FUNG|nr:hypothetical protein DSO57_1025699 [Entomophthora muscae]